MTLPLNKSRVVALVVAAGLFMENMDQTVIATSLPPMAVDLGTDPVALKLAFTSYLLSLAVFIPISGWTADRFGARAVFQLAMVVFTLGSIGCGLSGSLASLVVFRMLQGVGGAMMVPVARLIILRLTPRAELLQALTYLTLPALLGPVVGPPLGGFITTYWHWRWIFWINVPVCLLGVALAYAFLPEVRSDNRDKLDWFGFALSSIALCTLLFGITLLGRSSTSLVWTVLLLLVGAAASWLYVRHANQTAHPILDLRLLANPTFRSGVGGGAFFRIGIGAVPFLLPLMLQVGFGLNPFESGSLTFAAAAGAMIMKATAQPILGRFGFRRVLLANGLISAGFMAATALFTPATPHMLILLVLLVGGFLRSLQFTALNAITFADIPDASLSSATGLASVAQQLSSSIGVALAAIVLEIAQTLHGGSALQTRDFAVAFVALAIVSALSVFVHSGLRPEAGGEMIGRPATSEPPELQKRPQ